jgi:hypothetical protein
MLTPQCTMDARARSYNGSAAENGLTGDVDLRFEKRQTERLRKLGYRRHPQGSGWVRPLKRAWFPRFHLYTETDWQTKRLRLDLHLDHTRENPDSRGPTAASDGSAVSSELQRIMQLLATE